jgi:hypothetical protein
MNVWSYTGDRWRRKVSDQHVTCKFERACEIGNLHAMVLRQERCCRARILIHVISPSSGLHSGGRSEIFNE